MRLCFVKRLDNYHLKLWFTPFEPTDIWGDDWNDAPYEYNAEEPHLLLTESKSSRDLKESEISTWVLEVPFSTTVPEDEALNSPYTVERINKREVPWIVFKDSKANPLEVYAGTRFMDVLELVRKNDLDVKFYTEASSFNEYLLRNKDNV